MKKKTKTDDERPCKRRRSLRKRKQKRRAASMVLDEVDKATAYAVRFVAPIIMASIARRRGLPTVSPRDFYCGCAPSYKDGLPICERRKESCRFAERKTPARLADKETPTDEQRYKEDWAFEMLFYEGPSLPRDCWDRRSRH